MKTVVSERGRITIPKAIRTRLDIRPGDVLNVQVAEGRIVVTKCVPEENIQRVYGILKLSGGTDRAIKELRGPAT